MLVGPLKPRSALVRPSPRCIACAPHAAQDVAVRLTAALPFTPHTLAAPPLHQAALTRASIPLRHTRLQVRPRPHRPLPHPSPLQRKPQPHPSPLQRRPQPHPQRYGPAGNHGPRPSSAAPPTPVPGPAPTEGHGPRPRPAPRPHLHGCDQRGRCAHHELRRLQHALPRVVAVGRGRGRQDHGGLRV